MELLRSILSILIGGALSLFQGQNPLFSLVPLSVVIGIGMLWVFARTSNQEAIRKVKSRLAAHLYEMRLFTDEPVLIWKAQWGLLTANARYIGMMLLPAIVMTVPMILLFAQLECFYASKPLQPGQVAILTVQLQRAQNGATAVLRVPDGMVVESPGVHVESSGQISWRVRAMRPLRGAMQLVLPGETVEKSVVAGAGPQYLSDRRVSSWMDLVWHPGESQLRSGRVNWIELSYPQSAVHGLGLDLHWLIWLLVLSMITALLLKRRLGVTF